MPLRAVVLDLFDTLVDLRSEDIELERVEGRSLPAFLRAQHAAISTHAEIDYASFARVVIELDDAFRESHYARDRELPSLERFTALARRLGIESETLPLELTELHMAEIRRHVRVPPHHARLLGELAGRVRVGLCSNFSHSETALRILEEGSLARHLDAVVISDAIGSRKPAAEIFESVLSGLGAAPEETLHVGDSLRADVGGGSALGMRTAWLTRRIRDPEVRLREHEGARPDWVIGDLAELSALLDGANA